MKEFDLWANVQEDQFQSSPQEALTEHFQNSVRWKKKKNGSEKHKY